MTEKNPFEAPQASVETTPPRDVNDLWAPCPSCHARNPEEVGFTWWGGFVGAKMLNHVKCTSCGNKYNGKTGGSNTVGIVIYQVVAFAIVAAIYVLLMR